MRTGKYKFAIIIELLLIALLIGGRLLDQTQRAAVSDAIQLAETGTGEEKKDYIKWVDFTVPSEALDYAYEMDVKAHEEGTQLDWVCLLSYTAAQWGSDFSKKAIGEMKKAAQDVLENADAQKTATDLLEEKAEGLKYYPYYKEAYGAVLSGMVGPYRAQLEAEDGSVAWHDVYGLKAYSPIARGFDYSDYDDFGSSRSYGYSRPHLGHDMMGQIGTPIRIFYKP